VTDGFGNGPERSEAAENTPSVTVVAEETAEMGLGESGKSSHGGRREDLEFFRVRSRWPNAVAGVNWKYLETREGVRPGREVR
jgi:hypothetical protein